MEGISPHLSILKGWRQMSENYGTLGSTLSMHSNHQNINSDGETTYSVIIVINCYHLFNLISEIGRAVLSITAIVKQ